MTQANSGETYPTKVGATFKDPDQTQAALHSLVNDAELALGQIAVIEPNDREVERKVEPEMSGIAAVLARAHLGLGALGLLVGLSAAAILTLTGVEAAASSPLMTLIALGFFGAVTGLLLGGLISLRPDHERLILKTKQAAEEGDWALVVHARDHRQSKAAGEILRRHAGEVVETL